jgi:hopene-associated glycosyltransferase HpnB
LNCFSGHRYTSGSLGLRGEKIRGLSSLTLLAAAGLSLWLYLLLGRGGFWLCAERDDWKTVAVPQRPCVAVVIPARNEAAGIAASIRSLAQQDYPCTIVLVDDESRDGTAEIARAALATNGAHPFQIVNGQALPPGWTGKLWAVKQGIDAAMALQPAPEYLLLTDADIVHPTDSVTRLVAQARAKGLLLTSLMVELRCETVAERIAIPAFIFFFQMLYPFAWVNNSTKATAAAAGGCMLVRTDALARIGGVESIRDALIDDCALARALKRQGPIWLGVTSRVRSIRSYASLAEIRRMVVRSAYAQLRYSPLLLLATIAGMTIVYLLPPAMAIFAAGAARAIGLLTWGLMAVAFLPALRLYRVSPLWSVALPAIALVYMAFTLDSAYQYLRGRGGSWKGRVQANVSKP